MSQSEIRWFRKGEGTGLIGRLLGLIDIEFGIFFWVDVDGCSWKRVETNWFHKIGSAHQTVEVIVSW